MKKTVLIVALLFTGITYSQKKTNGTVYIDHPAIKIVEDMTKAFVSGDSVKVASFLADDFKAYSGASTNPNDKGRDKAAFLRNVKGWKEQLDYYSITRTKGAYPDAIEYSDKDQKDVVWVQTWEQLKGVHKKTGVKVDMPLHRLFVVNKDNKIKTIIEYSNSSVGDEIEQSFDVRENGTIYNHHEYINIVRNMVMAFENKDLVKSYSYYDEKARFRDINLPRDKTFSLAEQKENDKKILEEYDINSIDVVGYPDFLHYELNNAKVVLSWWNINLTRKKDKKEFVLPIMFMDNFNDEGKIIFETAYYSAKILE
ncbi:nuclear transport factor 2 family protein [Flavobacterium sp. AS60]|uniref:nuclear transport factor 2 family protein n=1 Tax=Flavobacterium anseongense TaxID=2910677 RepID=UPI001F400CC9|nr:nuclear transport factor 2 family protein [Flavobacterium sp. AS60]MCF6130505.1 nuclear transport factor 2 family protein [Flavobacterium sp. AS60]